MANRSGRWVPQESNEGLQGRTIRGPVNSSLKLQPLATYVDKQSNNYGGTSRASYNGIQTNSYSHGYGSQFQTLRASSNGNQTNSYSHGYASKFQPKVIATRQGQESNLQQWTPRYNTVNKQNGSYMRTTFRESSSAGNLCTERYTGRVGFKDEQKRTSTFKYGDKRGYFVYKIEEMFCRVNFDDSNSYNYGGSGQNNQQVDKCKGVIPSNECCNKGGYYDDQYYNEDCYDESEEYDLSAGEDDKHVVEVEEFEEDDSVEEVEDSASTAEEFDDGQSFENSCEDYESFENSSYNDYDDYYDDGWSHDEYEDYSD